MEHRPPRLALLLLRLLPADEREYVMGDLTEEYATRVRTTRGRIAADVWFWRHALGSLASVAAFHVRPAGHGLPFAALGHDVRYALRAFRSGRSALLVSAAILALAIGAGTVTYSVVSGVVLRSLPFHEPDRLVSVRVVPLAARGPDRSGATMGEASVETILSTEGVFESTALLYPAGRPVLTGLGDPVRVSAFQADPALFRVVGSGVLMGRPLVPSDAAPDAGTPVVLVSHGFWRDRLAGDPGAVGRVLHLDGTPHEIVGVTPRGFAVPEHTEIWHPRAPRPEATGSRAIQGRYWLIARLAPGVTEEVALTRLDERFQARARDEPGFATWGATLQPVYDLMVGGVRTPLLLLLGAVLLVLLVACANVAAVLLARGVARRREVAVRMALGGGRTRVARQLIIESVLLALGGGLAGLAIAFWGVPAAVSLMAGTLPRVAEITVDWRIAGVALAASALTGLLAGVLPALLSVRESLGDALKDGAAGSGVRGWRTRLGEALVVLQIGLGTVLTAGAALLVLTFVNLARVDLGFDPARVAVAEFTLPAHRYASEEAAASFLTEALARAEAIPGVEAAAASSAIPFESGAVGTVTLVDGETPTDAPWAWLSDATPGWFRVLDLRVLEGRGLEDADREAGNVVVNETFSRAWFPGGDAVGRTIEYYGSSQGRIVGVVQDARQEALDQPTAPEVFTPLEPGVRRLKISVRAAGAGGAGAAALREALLEVDPLLPIDRIGTLADRASETIARERFYAVALGLFSAIALLIAALGVYGITAYSVSLRSREIGVRMALGASRVHIGGQTLGRVAVLAVLGVGLGLAGAAAGSRLLEALLFGLDAREPGVFLAAALILAAVAMAAAWAPARRAARMDPTTVLHAE